jgi:hypothetical protein
MDTARIERVRLLLDELGGELDEVEREIIARWKDSAPADTAAREACFWEWQAQQRLRRRLSNVLRAEQLENPNG